ncbi:MAG: glutamate racemase [Acidimicrobiia bacterium]|nr:glutamate racemase [Acidimicrobiia bacterium]
MIGVFDSGVGGLSVLREMRRLLPQADLVYLADQARAPYGERSLQEVRDFSEAIARYLISRGSAPVVVACNTASAAALRGLREQWPGVPFVGMEPAVKPAATLTSSGKVGVLATQATFQGELFADLMARYGNGVEVLTAACPGLAALIEDVPPDDPAAADRLTGHALPLVAAGADVLVLGCTHYSFLQNALAERVGPGVTIVDPAEAVARRVAAVAEEAGTADGSGTTTYLTTGDPVRFARQIEVLLSERVSPEPVQL